MNSKNNEVLNGNPDDKITINSIEDFKQKLNIDNIPDGDLKDYFKEPVETTKGKLLELRKKYLKGEPSLESIKDFLVDNKNKILKASKKGADQLKEVTGDIKKSMNVEILKTKDGIIDGTNADKLLNERLKGIDNVKLPNSEETATIKKKANEVIKKGTEVIGWANQLEILERNKEEGGFKGFLSGILLFILNLLGITNKKEVVEKVKAKIETKINNIYIKKTKTETKKIIVNGLNEHITPEIEGKINGALENISEENLAKLYDKINKGELNYSEITKLLPELMNNLISKEQVEKTKKDIQEQLILALKKEIKNKYNIELDDNKILKLRELVIKNTNISTETIGLINQVTNKKELLVKDFFGPGFEAIVNTTSLMLGLIINGIIPISTLGIDFMKSGSDVIKLSIDSLGIGKTISMDTFNKSIETMSEQEKAVLIGLLYRKGGLFLSILGSLGETVSRLGIEFITKTEVKGYNLIGSSLLGNNLKQVENFDKLAKSLGSYKDEGNILKDALENIKRVQKNYIILDVLEKAAGNTAKAISELELKLIDIPNKNPNLTFDDFAKSFKNIASNNTTEVFSKGSMQSKFLFGASGDLYDFSTKLENITKAQRMMFDGNFLTKGISKLRELKEIGSISRLGDRMVLHFESKDQAIKGISKWNILANKFPELVKGCLDKLPIIAVAGITANSDKPFFETFTKEMKYLFPIVGPIWLVGDSGLSWENGKPKIKNGIDAGIGGALLALDGVFLLKELASGGLKGGATYMLKPLKDIYSIGRGTAEGIYSASKAISSGKSISGIFKESLEKSKVIKNGKLRALAVIGLIGYIGYNQAFDDDIINDLSTKDGKLDLEKLKIELPKLNDEKKKTCLIYILNESMSDNMMKDLEFSIINNRLYINSNNQNVQEQFLVDNELTQTLGLDAKVDFTYNPK